MRGLFKFSTCLVLPGLGSSALIAAPQLSIDQISNEVPSVETPVNGVPQSSDAPQQLTSEADSAPQSSQLSTERRSGRQPEQLSNEGKTARAPGPLSQPSDGHQVGVDRLAGADRCDPTERSLPKSTCSKVIENRASEFARPDVNALSPEQRLLLEQEVREGVLDAQSGARRLSQTGEADESLAAMGVAAVVLRPKEDPPAPKSERDEDAAKATEIIGAIIGASPAPPPPQ